MSDLGSASLEFTKERNSKLFSNSSTTSIQMLHHSMLLDAKPSNPISSLASQINGLADL